MFFDIFYFLFFTASCKQEIYLAKGNFAAAVAFLDRAKRTLPSKLVPLLILNIIGWGRASCAKHPYFFRR